MSPLTTALALAGVTVVAAALLHRLSWWTLRAGLKLAAALRPVVTKYGGWAYRHPLRAYFATRFPRLYAALQARLDPRAFTGLPLTLMIAAALYIATLLGGLVEDVLEKEAIVHVDLTVQHALSIYRVAPLIDIFLWITALGAGPGICAAAFIATGFLWADRRPAFILPLWITVLGSQATTYLGKFAIARTRPDFIDAVSATTPSFPSGHATATMAVYGFIAYAIARDLPGLRQRFEIAFWTGMVVLLVGFSRLFLSVHYLSDVLSGFLVGAFWLLVGFALVEWRRASEWAPERKHGADSPDE